jgi:hypothetical protein
VYLIIFFIIFICIAIWAVLFLNKPSSTEKTRREVRRSGKQFVFSEEKPFVASVKTTQPKRMQPEKPYSQIMKKEIPAAMASKITPTKIQTPGSQETEISTNKVEIIDDFSKNTPPQTHDDELDFDRLSELIDDFFSDNQDSKNFK